MRSTLLAIILIGLIGAFIKFAKRGDVSEGDEARLQKRIISECSSLGDVFSTAVQECEATIKAEFK
jgi:hypothetical protein